MNSHAHSTDTHSGCRELERKLCELIALARELVETNGGPIDGEDDNYVMVRLSAFESLHQATKDLKQTLDIR